MGSNIMTEAVLGQLSAEEVPPEKTEVKPEAEVEVPAEGEGEPAKDEAAVAAEAEAMKAEQHEELLMQASRFGLSRGEAMAFGSDAGLAAHIRVMDRIEKDRKEHETKTQTKADTVAVEVPEFKVDLEESEFDPKIVGAIKGMSKHQADAFKALTDKNAALEAQVEKANNVLRHIGDKMFTDAVNETIDSLGDAAAALGKKERAEVKATVNEILRRNPELGANGDLTPAVKRALAVALPDDYKNNVLKAAAATADGRSKLQKPGSPRNIQEVESKEDAIARMDEMIKGANKAEAKKGTGWSLFNPFGKKKKG